MFKKIGGMSFKKINFFVEESELKDEKVSTYELEISWSASLPTLPVGLLSMTRFELRTSQ